MPWAAARVAVVVHHGHARGGAGHVDAAGGAGEGAEARGETLERGRRVRGRDRGEGADGVEHVVVARDGEVEGEGAGGPGELDADAPLPRLLGQDVPGGVVRGAVAPDAGAACGGPLPQRPGAGIVRADHERALGIELRGELVEGRGEGGLVAVEVEVVRLEVGDHEGARAEGEEGAVGLVGLDHGEGLPRAAGRARGGIGGEARVAAQVGDGGAERPGRVVARSAQGAHGEPGGGGLPVGAGDGHEGAAHEQAREARGAVDDGDATLVGGHDLGVVRPHGGGDDEQVAVLGHEVRVEADADAGAGRAERGDELAVLGVGAAHREAGLEGEAGHGGHARAADPHHVHGAHLPLGPCRLGDHRPGAQDGAVILAARGASQAPRAVLITMSPRTSAASVMPKPRAAVSMRRRRSGSSSSGSTVSRR